MTVASKLHEPTNVQDRPSTTRGKLLEKAILFDAEVASARKILSDAYEYALACNKGTEPEYTERCAGVNTLRCMLEDTWDNRGKYALSRTAYATLLHKILACNDVSGRRLAVGAEEHDAVCEKICALALTCRNYLLSSFDGTLAEHDYILDCYVDGRMSSKSLEKHVLDFLRSAGQPTTDGLHIKTQALVRDSFKCALTGFLDAFAYKTLVKCAKIKEGVQRAFTESLYLIPLPPKKISELADFNPTTIPLLDFLGLWETVREMPAVHSVGNVITLHVLLRRAFDMYDIWLEEVDGESNVYRIAAADPSFWELETPLKEITGKVKLSMDPDVVAKGAELGVNICALPMIPDRQLIAFRAMCARVANGAGLLERLD